MPDWSESGTTVCLVRMKFDVRIAVTPADLSSRANSTARSCPAAFSGGFAPAGGRSISACRTNKTFFMLCVSVPFRLDEQGESRGTGDQACSQCRLPSRELLAPCR